MNYVIKVLGEPRGLVVLTVVLSSMEPKLIFYKIKGYHKFVRNVWYLILIAF